MKMKPCDVVWAHAANSDALRAACDDPAVVVVEGDVVILASGMLVMGPDPRSATRDALRLSDWLAATTAAGKGIKLDVKQYAAVPGVIRALVAHVATAAPPPLLACPLPEGGLLSRPATFFSADVLPAGSCACTFNEAGAPLPIAEQAALVRALVQVVGDELPAAVMSLGWSTCGEDGTYSTTDVDAMLAAVADVVALGVAVTFPVRGTWVRRSWPELQRLLRAGPLASLTVWSNVVLPSEDMLWMRRTLPAGRTFYDVAADGSRTPEMPRATFDVTRARMVLRTAALAAAGAAALTSFILGSG